jgi:hypothetical protein
MATSLARRLALPLLALVSAAVVAVPIPAAAAVETTDPAKGAAGWLARQLTNGDHMQVVIPDVGTFDDTGLTIDSYLAFAAAGVSGENAAKILTWLGGPGIIPGYIGDGSVESYVSVAKLALLVEVAGQDPTSYQGIDLIARLQDLLTATGQFKSKSAFPGDFTNTFTQSLAILALARADGVTVPASAVSFLAGVQCGDGGFPDPFAPPPGQTCKSLPDTTAMVVQALLAGGDTTNAGEGLTWLVDHQGSNGGFGDANGTGLAAQALRVGGKTAAADKAVAYLRTLQVGCDGLETNRGAIMFSPLDPAHPTNTGFQADTAPRATAQAILGLVGTGLLTLEAGTLQREAPTLTVDCPLPPATAPILPATGSPLTVVLWLAGGLLAVGTSLLFLVRVRRRRPGLGGA